MRVGRWLYIGFFIYGCALVFTFYTSNCKANAPVLSMLGNVGDVAAPVVAYIAYIAMVNNFKEMKNRYEKTEFERRKDDLRNIVFKFIDIHHIVVSRMQRSKDEDNESGVRYFRNRKHKFVNRLNGAFMTIKQSEKESKYDEVYYSYLKERFGEFFSKNHNQLGQYFRYVYNVLREIDEMNLYVNAPDMDYIEKKKYVSLYVAQLTGWEYFFLLSNAIFNVPKSYKFSRLAQRYNIFQHMPNDILATCDNKVNANGKLNEWVRQIQKGSYPTIIENEIAKYEKLYFNDRGRDNELN